MTTSSYSTTARKPDEGDRYPLLGMVPRTALGRVFFVWGVVNVVLALLPVFNIVGNGSEIGPLGMPLTVVYCYAVFSLNCLMGAAYYLTRGKAWVEIASRPNGNESK